MNGRTFALLGLIPFALCATAGAADGAAAEEGSLGTTVARIYFPPPGESLEVQARRSPAEVGLDPAVVEALRGRASRWALWRYGYLVHTEGDFNQKTEVKSLRKTWHALTVGAAIGQDRLVSLDEPINRWVGTLTGNDALATWKHVLTQSAGFDYPYGDYPDFKPGEMWTYSDLNLDVLCTAMARVYGKDSYREGYDEVVKAAYFDAIGMRGWETSVREDGIRFDFDLEDTGRLGLLVMARGEWAGKRVIPRWFVEELETKQTVGVRVNYDGPNDGKVGLDPVRFPEAPYGYLTWTNSASDLYPGADAAWAYGAGAGGTYILWNHRNSIVFAGVGVDTEPSGDGIPHVIERHLAKTERSEVEALPAAPKDDTASPAAAGKDLGDLGTFHKWHRSEITLTGPEASAGAEPNPFLTEVAVTFEGPGGTFTVPAFYDGDAKGTPAGNVWKVRFSANATGRWTFTSRSPEPDLAGWRGSFAVDEPPADAPGFLRWGRLRYAGERYLKFTDGPYWIKGGADDPENFLGMAFPSEEARKQAVNHLAAKGVNSIYVMTHTLGGDRNDTWPWLGSTPAQARANHTRFDTVRLAAWEDFFTHCQERGVVLHLVLEDDSAWSGYDHDLYYREMVARFGHHPALIWNLGEEANENYSDAEQLELARTLRKWDAYGHPVTVHRLPTWPFLGRPEFDLTSIQAGGGTGDFTTSPLPDYNAVVAEHLRKAVEAGRPVPVMIDETPGVTAVTDETRFKMRAKLLYPLYLAGGNYELHFKSGYPGGTGLKLEELEPMWEDMTRARRFLEALPFDEMKPGNQLLRPTEGNYCLAKPGEAYAVYLSAGGEVKLDLREAPGTFETVWYNVTTGERKAGNTVAGGDWHSLGRPPFPGDVAATVLRREPIPNSRGGAPPSEAKETTTVKVALIQYQVQEDDAVGVDAERVKQFVCEAAENGAELVVAPETCFYRYKPWEQNGATLAQLADEYDRLKDIFSDVARQRSISLVIGLREPHDEGHVYNTALFFGPDGSVLGKHRKVVPSSAETAWCTAGISADPFRAPFGRVGMLICKDAKTDWSHTYDRAGLDLLILIAGDDDGTSFTRLPEMCRDGRCFGVLANQVTKHGQGKGNSAVVTPDREPTFLGGGEQVFYVEFPLPASRPTP